MIGAHATSAVADDWKAKAKKNVKLGVMSGVYSHLPLKQAVAKIKAEGFGSVVTDFAFADVRFNPLAPDWQAVNTIPGRPRPQRHSDCGPHGLHQPCRSDCRAAEVRPGEDRVPAGQLAAPGLLERLDGDRHVERPSPIGPTRPRTPPKTAIRNAGPPSRDWSRRPRNPARSFPSRPIGATSSTRLIGPTGFSTTFRRLLLKL